MYITYKIDQCDECRRIEDSIKLKEWNEANPDLANLTWEGSRPDLILKRKNAGYYQWTYEEKPVIYIEADCHGDSMQLCYEHLVILTNKDNFNFK